MSKGKVLLGMSGGVDSSVSAILLKNAGYDVIGITMKLWQAECEGSCCNIDSTRDAKRVCDSLGIPHYAVNFTKEFKTHVVDDFVDQYIAGRTPNPCIECNKYMKFDLMYKKAKELGCEYIATGHYAKVEYSDKYNCYVLKKSNSIKKDQSYVLYTIPKGLVSKIIFPLSEYESKDEIRKIAADNGLDVASKPDSEDICFIPDNDYVKFLKTYAGLKLKQGNIVDRQGNILGKHEGYVKYTIGQRRGLGVSYKEPLFVTGINKDKNEVIVGTNNDILRNELYANKLNFLLFDKLEEPIKVKAKIRYAAKEAKATIYPVAEDKVRVVFEEKQRSITPGQSVVFYIDDILLGGGKII